MSKLKLTDKITRFRGMKSVILEKMANNAIYQFKVENFDKQGFVDNTIQPWAPRKSKKDNAGRKINVKTGRMRNDTGIKHRSENSITVGNDVPYAVFINEGTNKMVARPFIGNSKKLEAKNQALLESFLNRL